MTDADKKLYDKAVEALDQMGAGLPSEIEKYVPAWIDGYQKGLKAKINATTISDCPIKAEWHKVADGDLPDNTDSVLSDKGVIVYYNFTHACWVDERASVEIDDVVAWCEIPQYTEG